MVAFAWVGKKVVDPTGGAVVTEALVNVPSVVKASISVVFMIKCEWKPGRSRARHQTGFVHTSLKSHEETLWSRKPAQLSVISLKR